jgi:uncharacterized BrkB/YihY/UPF0761 family membrane protein
MWRTSERRKMIADIAFYVFGVFAYLLICVAGAVISAAVIAGLVLVFGYTVSADGFWMAARIYTCYYVALTFLFISREPVKGK